MASFSPSLTGPAHEPSLIPVRLSENPFNALPVESFIDSLLKDFARLATEGQEIDGILEAAKLRTVSCDSRL